VSFERPYGARAPVSMRPIHGHHGLWEIRTGGYRTLYCLEEGVLWVLHVCKKEHPGPGITSAARRLKVVKGR
jgi:mRNA-degrading endonuclease RelE of RelBE toxin-antitoxin system